MKNLIFLISVVTILTSCGSGNTDINTVDGAANVMCDLMDQIVVAANDDNPEKISELTDKVVEYNHQIDKAIEDGKYTREELDAILIDRNCDF